MSLQEELTSYLRTERDHKGASNDALTSLSKLAPEDQFKVVFNLSLLAPQITETQFFIDFVKQDWVKELCL